MSIMERLSSVFLRPNDGAQGDQEEAPLLIRLGSRVLACAGAFFCVIFGLWNCVISLITINITCMLSGMLEMLVGFVIMALEFPKLVSCLDLQDKANFLESKPKWYRAAIYCVLAVPPVFLCFGLASFFGCGLVFGAGSLYGMIALGKKASAEDMRQAAVSSGYATNPTTNDRAGIVDNAQPFSFTGAVGTDSNV